MHHYNYLECCPGVREGGEYSTTTIRTSTVLTSTLPWDNLSLEMERAFRRQEQERAASRARAHQQGAVQGPGQPEAGSNEVELIPEPAKRTRPASSGKSGEKVKWPLIPEIVRGTWVFLKFDMWPRALIVICNMGVENEVTRGIVIS